MVKHLKYLWLWLITCLLSPLLSISQVSADFTSDKNSGCSPLIVNFTDQSTGSPTSHLWLFGNGNSSTEQNPTAFYNNPGTYDVTLVVSSGAGGTDSLVLQDYITVFSNPTADFVIVSDSMGCVPLTVEFRDSSVQGSGAITDWEWYYGDGVTENIQHPTHIYNIEGNISVKLEIVDTNGCEDVFTMNNAVRTSQKPDLQFDVSDSMVCSPPLNVTFTNNSSGTTPLNYIWDFGDSTVDSTNSPVHNYTTRGIFDVTLIGVDQNQCADTLIDSALISTFGLEADFGVSDSDRNVCMNEQITFSDSTIGKPLPNTFTWTIDNKVKTGSNVNYVFTDVGPKSAQLIVTNGIGCADTLVKDSFVNVIEPPDFDWGADTLVTCDAPATVNFYDSTQGIVKWDWSFGNGGRSFQQNPQSIYNQIGSYTVSVALTDSFGCVYNRSRNTMITVHDVDPLFYARDYETIPPNQFVNNLDDTVLYQVIEGCAPLNVKFWDSTEVFNTSSDSIVSWQWDFGDGNADTVQHPVHTYTTPDTTYDVTLTVTNSAGCQYTFTRNQFIRTGSKPVADFTIDEDTVCVGDSILFIDNSSTANQWIWDFGDGSADTVLYDSIFFEYADPGNFSVMLIADNNGCQDTIIKPNLIEVQPPSPIGSYIIDCDSQQNVRFFDASIGADSVHWDFGDGNTDTLRNPVHRYDSLGNYQVRLTATNDSTGCTVYTQDSILLKEPRAIFTADTTKGCQPLTVNFTGDSSIDATAVGWYWDFGDGETEDSLPNVSHQYDSTGFFDVMLVVTDTNGCPDTSLITQYIRVNSIAANFGADTNNGCAPLQISFTDSSVSDTTITQWDWNFGDGSTDSVQNPVHVYQNPGTYTVRLTVSDSNSCSSTFTRSNYIRATFPDPGFSVDKTDICLNDSVTFTNSSTGTGLAYLWDFGDGNTDSLVNPVHTYSDSSLYGFDVTLTVTDVNGCDTTIIMDSLIRVQDPVADFYGDSLAKNCPPLSVNFTDSSYYQGYITSFNWQFGDGNLSTQQNPVNLYDLPGFYDVRLIVTTDIGCKDTIVKQDYIKVSGPDASFTLDPASGCIPHNVTFLMQNDTNVANTLWDFGDGLTGSGDSVGHTYNRIGTFTPSLVLLDDDGCERLITAPGPVTTFGVYAGFQLSDTLGCEPVQVTITDSSSFAVDWQWDFGDSTRDSVQQPSPHLFPEDSIDTTYTIRQIVTSANGCTDTLMRTVHVLPTPMISAGTDTIVCRGEAALLQASGALNYNWTPVTGLSHSDSSRTLAQPEESTIYKILGSNLIGCNDSAFVTVTIDDCGDLFVPNAFSPNGDGLNDYFSVFAVDYTKIEVNVFSRWGANIFSSQSIDDSWDGTFQGGPVDAGTYAYWVYVEYEDGTTRMKKGRVTVLR